VFELIENIPERRGAALADAVADNAQPCHKFNDSKIHPSVARNQHRLN
jgi:hypothetical protein